jgi:hypothetical protein
MVRDSTTEFFQKKKAKERRNENPPHEIYSKYF